MGCRGPYSVMQPPPERFYTSDTFHSQPLYQLHHDMATSSVPSSVPCRSDCLSSFVLEASSVPDETDVEDYDWDALL